MPCDGYGAASRSRSNERARSGQGPHGQILALIDLGEDHCATCFADERHVKLLYLNQPFPILYIFSGDYSR